MLTNISKLSLLNSYKQAQNISKLTLYSKLYPNLSKKKKKTEKASKNKIKTGNLSFFGSDIVNRGAGLTFPYEQNLFL